MIRLAMGFLVLMIVLVPAPARAQDKYFDSDGVRIRYVERGSGEPIVLLHGLSGDVERNWINTGVLPALSKNFRVIAVDFRGHGKSDKPHDPKAYGMEVRLDVVRLLDHLKIPRAHILGYSYGGQIVSKLLTTHPERFITAILGGSAAVRGTLNPQAIERLAAEFEGPNAFRTIVLQVWPSKEPVPTEEDIRKYAQQFAAPNDLGAMAALIRGWSDVSVTDAQLKAIRVPTLAVIGAADQLLANVNTMKEIWPELKVVTIEGATHSNIVPPGRGAAARPEFVNAIREFIAAHQR
jgi:pimeloyl-ACP methyl ester carboxylesterase